MSARGRVVAIQSMVAGGGLAALSWEVVWQLQASLAFGVSALGTALTLAATMGGMAVGAFVAGWRLQRREPVRPLRLYAALELVIGLSGTLVLSGFRVLEALDTTVWQASPSLAAALHLAGMALLLAPPTIAMGASVPVFQLVARSYGTSVATLYAVNTAGAGAGVLLMTFALLPTLGVAQTCAVVACVNAVVALAAFALPAGARTSDAPDAPDAVDRVGAGLASNAIGRHAPALACLVVTVTGFVTFGLEVVWFRALRAAFWSTSATFALILAAVLVPLAVGARLVPWMRRRGLGPGPALACAGVAILLATPMVERMDLVVHVSGSYARVMVTWFGLTLLVVGPAVLCLATALPWFLEEYRDASRTGQLYGFNTLGSVLGSLAAAWLLLPNLGFARSAWLLGMLLVVTAAALCTPTARRWALAASAAALALAVGLASSPGRDRPYGTTGFENDRIVAFEEGPDFTTTVVEGDAGVRFLLIDGFAASGENPVRAQYMSWMGSLPAIMHPDPRDTLVICFGTGRTANALRRETDGRVDVVDVSSSVLDLAPLFEVNERVLEDPRVEAITMDGRAWLRRTDRRYDVITLEPMPPNFSGVNSLYSKEFYEIAKAALRPGGVVAQWLPIHLLDPEHAASVARTFQAVFPDAVLWIDPFGGTGILLGRHGLRAVEGLWPGLARRPGKRSLSDEEVNRAALLGPEALRRYAEKGRIVSDDNQLLAFSRFRPGTDGTRQRETAQANWKILAEVAGHAPYYLPRAEAYRRVWPGARSAR